MRKNQWIAMLLLVCFVCMSMLSLGAGCKKPEGPNTQQDGSEGDENQTEGGSGDTLNPFAALTYVAFGDSITYGADHRNDYQQMEKPYPKLVGQELGLNRVENLGSSGASFTPNAPNVCMTERILAYTGKADIISVHLGFNDWARTLPLGTPGDDQIDTVYGCLDMIAKHLTTAYPDAFIFFITPFKTSVDRNDEYTLQDVSLAIQEVAAEYFIPVLDLYELGQFELEMYTEVSDGVHPTQAFFKEYTAPQIAEFIREKYGKE